MIGVAFESLDDADNIGYIIPTNIIKQFLNNIETYGNHRGFGSLGIIYENLESIQFCEYLKLPSSILYGILITHCTPVSPISKVNLL